LYLFDEIEIPNFMASKQIKMDELKAARECTNERSRYNL